MGLFCLGFCSPLDLNQAPYLLTTGFPGLHFVPTHRLLTRSPWTFRLIFLPRFFPIGKKKTPKNTPHLSSVEIHPYGWLAVVRSDPGGGVRCQRKISLLDDVFCLGVAVSSFKNLLKNQQLMLAYYSCKKYPCKTGRFSALNCRISKKEQHIWTHFCAFQNKPTRTFQNTINHHGPSTTLISVSPRQLLMFAQNTATSTL